ncbi:MAG: hypothetical protein KGI90_08320 [Burkholderiales bacterium]|nr:hypothetical protein [Burkholderiales bacterium]MDE2276901.1 hypothetical protein [Burkholderiales bacterium]
MSSPIARQATAFGLSAALTLAVMAGLEQLATPSALSAPALASPQLVLNTTAQPDQVVVIQARRLPAA